YSLYVHVTAIRDRSLTRTAFFLTLTLFFAPMFLSTNIDVAFFSYAIAHGLQYLVFMTVLVVSVAAREGRRGISGPMLLIVLAIGVPVAVLGFWMTDLKTSERARSSFAIATALDFVVGMILGGTLAHFVVDAGAWRLSQPTIRQFV